MNEAETRAELIDPQLKDAGWGVVEGSRILREYQITDGKIQSHGNRAKPLKADYILIYKNRKLAVIEAKSDERETGEGVNQAKNYSEKLCIPYAFAANGKSIYQICMRTGKEGTVPAFPAPDVLWNSVFGIQNEWREKFEDVPYEDAGGSKASRYYQEIAVNNVMTAIASGRERILLTLATGTGKTFIAFQIAWKLYQTRWNLNRDGKRRPRILFLADRNILANQAFIAFSAFPEDALVRISPKEIRKKGGVPVNGSIFFTIFQTFMTGNENTPYFGEYPRDFFDFIIIDECHRGGANDESNWRDIMDYFSPAVQLGLTATPKRKDNADTYRYFGEPVYIYSLKDGINDGFLTPFKVKRVQTTMDTYVYTPDDTVIEGEVEQGRIYEETDFNRIIEIREREAERVRIILDQINQNEKSIIFCANQNHALAVRDLVNQYKKSADPLYCVRVTANDGDLGEQHLRSFQDNEKLVPTILTTSQKLSTGVDARNIRNIILMRPVNSMIEFKQIIGRGTRLFEGKDFFTIYDFVDACKHFSDPEWDGEPIQPEPESDPQKKELRVDQDTLVGETEEPEKKQKLKIKLRDGKEREIQHMIGTSYWSADGKPMSAEELIKSLYGTLPSLFKNEKELCEIWSVPKTRTAFLAKLASTGFGYEDLEHVQVLINAEKSDLFDVLEYVYFAVSPITREMRVARAQPHIYDGLDNRQKDFLDFVLSKYIETGVSELSQEKLSPLLQLKYQSLTDAAEMLGGNDKIKAIFIESQKYLYAKETA